MKIIIMSLILFVILNSLIQFILFRQESHPLKTHKISLSFEVFYTLIVIYCIVIIGFGLIYFVLSFYELTLVENVKDSDSSTSSLLLRSFYFSGVTLLTIGYGDITPLGFGRFVAIIQALIGFILPTAFVLKLVHLNFEQKRHRS
ncbi:ion channel [Pseudogracilibacillus auburnensis]|uniref:Potassium channel LctB n=1 Tax=Pseudogracilibacillus auburnensis TaxID=1494959 RepID=A0A2V3W8T5_9BACI|nr:potassium channel family protein [Pseudogracilibacillus auburnensis]MBO1001508.1 two pore domain potassium channel family protein [Pseudogracilibacillus auburnensis]PXW89574.1 potassium channel LctB [Pseudogracilibacillus auburnensis]